MEKFAWLNAPPASSLTHLRVETTFFRFKLLTFISYRLQWKKY